MCRPIRRSTRGFDILREAPPARDQDRFTKSDPFNATSYPQPALYSSRQTSLPPGARPSTPLALARPRGLRVGSAPPLAVAFGQCLTAARPVALVEASGRRASPPPALRAVRLACGASNKGHDEERQERADDTSLAPDGRQNWTISSRPSNVAATSRYVRRFSHPSRSALSAPSSSSMVLHSM